MKSKIHRVEVDFTERGFAQLGELQKNTGHETKQKLIQSALRLYYQKVFGWNYDDSVIKQIDSPLDSTPGKGGPG